jgi:AbiV family abortive infection protein
MSHILSKPKLKKLATMALANSIELHLDSIILFRERRYSSAFYFSVIAMEEMAKAKHLEHYFFYYTQNPDYDFEQKFLLHLHNHSFKQKMFIGRDLEYYSPKYYDLVEKKGLDNKKMTALYVGLDRKGNTVNTRSRVSIPDRIKLKDAKQQISVFNTELKRLMKSIDQHEYHFFIAGMDEVLLHVPYRELVRSWRFKSGLHSERWWKSWSKIFSAPKVKT